MSEILIHIDRVSKRYGPRVVLDDVSLEIARGETVALIGPSGGGKSTLLRSINGLTTFDAGEIRVGSHRLAAGDDRSNRDSVRAVRRAAGMVFQDFQLFPHLTALANITEAPIHVRELPRLEAESQARTLLERVGLGDRGDAYPAQLSGGQKQRVAIARALAMEPQVLLCDEITSALDPELKHEVLAALADLRRDGMTLVVVTHEIGFARRCGDRVVVLAEGRVIEHGPPQQVLDDPQSLRTRQFLKNVLA